MVPVVADNSQLLNAIYTVGLSLGLLLSIQILLQLWVIRVYHAPKVHITYDWDDYGGDYWRTDHASHENSRGENENISRKTAD